MIRTSRLLTRLFFIAVLAAIVFGGWFASQAISIQLDDVQLSSVDSGNWIDLASSLGEEAIQLFMGLTSE